MSALLVVLIVLVAILVVLLAVEVTQHGRLRWLPVQVISQSEVGVVKRFGRVLDAPEQFFPADRVTTDPEQVRKQADIAPAQPERSMRSRSVRRAGLTWLIPFVETMDRVDMRLTGRQHAQQPVITRDNVPVKVDAIVFSMVTDPIWALYAVSDYKVAVDQISGTALRAIMGAMSLDACLSQREQINAKLREQLRRDTDKWGVEITRVEILDILPSPEMLKAMEVRKEADQKRQARILESEGEQQAQVNIAEGRKTALILEAEGRARAIETVYAAINQGHPTPELIAVLQLDTLGKFAESPNSKFIVPAESASMLGAVQALKSVLEQVPVANGVTHDGGSSGPPPPSSPRRRGEGPRPPAG